jgi:hypothetical protein
LFPAFLFHAIRARLTRPSDEAPEGMMELYGMRLFPGN